MPTWINGDIPEKKFNSRPPPTIPQEVKTPTEYFRLYFDEDVLDFILEQTNIYGMQRDGKPLNATKEEILSFFGIMIYMGICSLPNMEDYWALKTRVPQVADALSLKRFQKLRSRLHFHDNLEAKSDDPWQKIRVIMDKIRLRCQTVGGTEYSYSVDECMVRYKGTYAGKLRQYLPLKPSTKWGFKLFALAGKSGIVHDFIPYCGSYTFKEEPLTNEERSLGVGASAVIALCSSIPHPELSTITFDNWYSGIPLVTYLKKELGLHSLGTILRTRIGDCKFSHDQRFKTEPRGYYESKINEDGIIIIKWMDSKPVHLISTFVGVRPVEDINRYVKEVKSKVPVACPKAVKVYNSTMGGVDLSDMLMSLHQIPSKSSRRFYFPMVGYLLDMCLTNAWLMYKRDSELLKLDLEHENSKQFRLAISESLTAGTRSSRGLPSLDRSLSKSLVRKPTAARPVDDVRTDGKDHWPQIKEKGRCRYCSKLTRITCSKCNCRLCLVDGRNCFTQFHCQKKLKSKKRKHNNNDTTEETLELEAEMEELETSNEDDM